MEPQKLLFVLVHDAWHGAWCWDGVLQWLEERGGQGTAFDLPGHGAFFQPEQDGSSFSLEKYAGGVEKYVRWLKPQVPGYELILAGHGTAGPILQLASENLENEVAGLVFIEAFILNHGESIAGEMPPEMKQVMENLAGNRPDKSIPMEALATYWEFNVINDDTRRAAEILARLTPEPAAPLFEPIRLDKFFSPSFSLPRAYISFNDDLTLPPGSFHPRMAARLGPHPHLTVNAGHEGPLTKPREVAEALLFLGQHSLKRGGA